MKKEGTYFNEIKIKVVANCYFIPVDDINCV